MDASLENKELLRIDEQDYLLKPYSYRNVEGYYQQVHHYQQLSSLAESNYRPEFQPFESKLLTDQYTNVEKLLPTELCSALIEEFDRDPDGIKSPHVLEVLLPQIFTEQVDKQVTNYFNSNYAVFWWSIYRVDATTDETDYYSKWHCDGGPNKHLKLLIYLNDSEEHGSKTGFLPVSVTDKLKDVGYIFNDINDRHLNISSLCQHFDIPFEPQMVAPDAGDCLIFNPFKAAHKAFAPNTGSSRYALCFCLTQSPFHWREVAQQFIAPIYSCQPFEGFAATLLKIYNDHAEPSNQDNIISIPLNNRISDEKHITYLTQQIFSDARLVDIVNRFIIENSDNLAQCTDVSKLIGLTKSFLISQLQPEKLLNSKVLQGLNEVSDYEQSFTDSLSRYDVRNKPNPLAIYWPNPNHPKYPQSKYEILPYVNKHPIMDISTPIGSAGSCFAFEIAKYLQMNGFNYVVTERNDNPQSGLIVDGYQPGDQYAKFCANYGILFNTPSFLQLAEKAFGIKKFNQLFIETDQGYYLDPYRENVVFLNKEAYLADYDKHIEAVKQSFLQSEVFVVTLGLNECWQLHDGTFMSRNPRPNMYQLVKHRTLTVQENVDNIQRFFDIIKAHNPKFKLIISVSPIPFLASGRANEQHVISANCHSKSVLRVAADQLVANNEDMYYLPSYELVTEGIKDAWKPDHRHVKPETVQQVVSMFKEIFVIDKSE